MEDRSKSHEQSVPLTFGAIISISSLTNLDSFIYIDGFVEDKALAKQFTKNNNPKLIYSKTLFQIYPQSINTNKKRALQKKQELISESLRIHQQGAVGDPENKKIDEISELQESILTEFKINLENFKKTTGQPVLFGQPIQLLHVASNKFLSYRKTEARLERQNYKVGLDEYSNESTSFRFLPCYKHQEDSEGTVFLHDHVFIASVNSILNKVPYLHFSNPISTKEKRQKLNPLNGEGSPERGQATDRKEGAVKKTKVEVNVSLESRTKMKVNLYSNYVDIENNYLECGDIVWLNHSELAVTLVCVTEFKDNNFKFKVDFDGNRVTDQFKQFIGNTNGMWVIEKVPINEKQAYQDGGFVEWNETYRFKHLGSGLYLTVKKTRRKNEQQAENRIVLEAETNEDNEFVFIPIASNIPKNATNRRYVPRDTFALIMHKKTKLIIHASFEKDPLVKNLNGEEGSRLLGETKPTLEKYGVVSEQAAFKVVKANYNEVWETNFLISCFPVLKSFLKKVHDANQKGAMDKFAIDELLRKLDASITCVKDLDLFCNNKLFNASPDQKYAEANSFRQKLLKEQYFIDILVMILRELVTKKELEMYESQTKLQKFIQSQSLSLNLKDISRIHSAETEENKKTPILGDYARRDLGPNQLDNNRIEYDNLRFIQKKIKLCHYIYALIKSICKNNYENEIYTFNLIPLFLIQCKYIPQAVECVMSIIQGNNYILNKLNENIKMDIDSTLGPNGGLNLINVIINIIDTNEQALNPKDVEPFNPEHNKNLKISKPVNIINFFLNLLKDQANKTAHTQLLTFFRQICCRNRTGLTVNQDLLYKIVTYNPKFINSFMMSFTSADDKITVTYPTTWTENDSSISISDYYKQNSVNKWMNIEFLEEQLNLYSDLAISRNYLWKVYLEKRFPPSIVFSTIWDEKTPKNLRAIMCALALTVYIDHEPFNQLILPRMCRIYDSPKKGQGTGIFNIKLFGKDNKIFKGLTAPKANSGDQEVLLRNDSLENQDIQMSLDNLIVNIVNYLKQETGELESQLDQAEGVGQRRKKKGNTRAMKGGTQISIAAQKVVESSLDNSVASDGEKEKPEVRRSMSRRKSSLRGIQDRLNDNLLLNVVQLFSKLVSFDILRQTGKRNLLYKVMSFYTKILEFDYRNPGYSFLLDKLRKTNSEKKIENIKKKDLISVSGFKNVLGSVVDNFTEITGSLGDLLNISQQKMNDKSQGSGLQEVDEQNLYNNPSMRSMLSLHYQLERLKIEEDDRKLKADVGVKLEICGTFDFLLNMRKNYLISNFLAWYYKLGKSMCKKMDNIDYEQKLLKKINSSIPKIIPSIAKTGILDLDDEFLAKQKDFLNLDSINIFKKSDKKKKHVGFKNYIEDFTQHPDFVPELDVLLLGEESKLEELTSELLPSLMVTFLKTKDSELEMRLLDVIMRLFNQRTELFKALESLEILFEPAEKKSYEFVEKQSAQLKLLTERLEIWSAKYIEGEGGEQELADAIKILDQLTLLLDTYNYVGENGDLVIVDSNMKNVSSSRQNIMKYLETHKPVLTISKDGLHTLNKIVLDENVPESKKRGLVELFTKVHIFLQQFCKGSAPNQVILAEYCDTLLEYAHLDVGQIDLLCSIYSENRFLCETIPDSFLQKFIALIENEGRQACFLKFFKVIQKVEESYIPENQIRVLKSLINTTSDNPDKLAMTLYGSWDHNNNFGFNFEDLFSLDVDEDLITKLAQHSFKDTYRDQPFIYHAKLLDILTCTIKGTESFNVSKAKLRGLFSFSYLLEMIANPDSMTSKDALNTIVEEEEDKGPNISAKNLHKLKGVISVFQNDANKTHQDQKPSDLTGAGAQNRRAGFSLLKSKLAEFITELHLKANTRASEEIADNASLFDRIIEVELLRIQSVTPQTVFEPEFFEYVFGSFLPLLHEYATKYLNDKRQTAVIGKGRVETSFYDFASALLKSLPAFRGKLTYTQVENLENFLEAYAVEYQAMKDERTISLDALIAEGQEFEIPKKKKKKSSDKDIIDLEDDDVDGSPSRGRMNSVWATRENWLKVIGLFTENNTRFQAALDEEKTALSKAIVKFSDLFTSEDKDKHRVTLESKDLIKKLIKYLQFGFSNKARKETMIATLQTLKKMVEHDDPKEREKLQYMLDKYEGTKMFLTVLSDSSNQSMDAEILNNFLELGIHLLEGGNLRIQKNIYNYFTTFQKSEVLFSKLYSILTTHGTRLNKGSLSDKASTSMESSIDEFSELGPVILENTLRLLQQFTEGHNLDIQNYLRHQTNSRNNYDMVAAVVELLRSYIHRMDISNYESMMRCLDTLAEFVQGPCPENQTAIIDGKFFDVAYAILTYNPKKILQKGLTRQETTQFSPQRTRSKGAIEKWMIARLKHKTFVLILSLLEMRHDKGIIKRIMRSLPTSVIKKNLITVWKRYKSLYKTTKYLDEALGHADDDPMDLDPNEREQKMKHYELITETGFSCFFLLESYHKVEEYDPDRKVVDEVTIKKMQSNTKKANILEASIVGQFGSFGMSFLKSGLDMASVVKNQLNKNLLKIAVANTTNEDEKRILKEIERKKLLREGLKFFAENSSHIEVLRNKKPEKVFFHLRPFCHHLAKEIKTNFNDEVDRSNVQSKVTGLVQSSDEIIRIMQHEEKLISFFNKNKIIGLFANHINLWENLAFYLSLAVNFIILSSYSAYFGDEGDDDEERRLRNPRFFLKEGATGTLAVLKILSAVMLGASLVVVLFFMTKKMPLIITKVWFDEEESENAPKKRKGIVMRAISFAAKIALTFFQLLTTPKILYYILYGAFAVLGTVVHPFFLTFHLTEVLIRYPTLQDVVRSFWEPKKALGLTFVLFVILEYFFTLIAYIYFYEDYGGNCETTLHCFLYTFDYTFKANGGIGGRLVEVTQTPPGGIKMGRFFFDNIFNIIIVIVVVSIVAGIIIDTFGSLREKDNEMKMDVQEICFICGFDRETFDRKSDAGGGFIGHIKIDHYMWNYVHFISHLKMKDPTEYTGIESYISDKLKEGDVSWFPSHKAIVLEDKDNEEENHIEELAYIDENMIETKKTARSLANTLNLIREKLFKSHDLKRRNPHMKKLSQI